MGEQMLVFFVLCYISISSNGVWHIVRVCVCVCVCVSRSVMSESLQPIDCSLPGHGILQARILE